MNENRVDKTKKALKPGSYVVYAAGSSKPGLRFGKVLAIKKLKKGFMHFKEMVDIVSSDEGELRRGWVDAYGRILIIYPGQIPEKDLRVLKAVDINDPKYRRNRS